MNCKDVIELLVTGFGFDDLPAELRQHIDQCPDCMALQQELQSIHRKVEQSSEFDFTDAEIENAVAGVEKRLDADIVSTITAKQNSSQFTTFANWLRPMARIAAVVLFVAATYGAYRVGQLQVGTSPGIDSLVVSGDGIDESDWLDSNTEYMDDAMISTLIDDFSDHGYFEAGEAILDDLTDEEMEYLIENFDVGDIL